jgi:mycothiol synthase
MGRANRVDGIPWLPSAEELAAEWHGNAGLDLADVVVAEVDGEVVAVAGTEHAERDGRIVHHVFGHVDPAWRRRGLGRALLAGNMQRARTTASVRAPAGSDATGGPRELDAWAGDRETGHRAILEAVGFRPVRWFFVMRRPTLDGVDVPDLPDGLEIRPVLPADGRTILAAENEAFRDHWGHRGLTEHDVEKTFTMPGLDTSLWVVAWDGTEVAGVVQSWIWDHENRTLGVRRGWLERISVRRPWRRRGLARAITARALVRLRDAGMEEAILGVDAENPTGALGLYDTLGFAVDARSAAFRRPLEDADPG